MEEQELGQVTEPKKEEIVLSDDEKRIIEMQRQESQLLENFKNGYERLVSETGYAWAVDPTSPINNPRLTIGKLQRG